MRTYRPTRGLVVGALGAAAAVVLGVAFVIGSPSGTSAEVCCGLLLFAGVVWAVLLRPCVRLGERDVHVVGSLSTVQIPCEQIELVSAGQYLLIDTGDRRYSCAAIGHSRRELGRAGQTPMRGIAAAPRVPLRGLVVEDGRARVESQAERVRELVEQAAAAAKRRPRKPVPPVTRSWDPLPIAVLTLPLIGLVATIVVGATA
ncbi:hypothetical protein [Nocardioides montaniterrae]